MSMMPVVVFAFAACTTQPHEEAPQAVPAQPAPSAPEPAPPPTPEERFSEGRHDAEASFRQGDVSYLEFGEPLPEDAIHRPTGLPLGSMGCEWDELSDAYARGYNERTAELIADMAPFPDTLTVTWAAAGGKALTVTRRSVLADGAFVSSTDRGRLKVGILSQKLLETPGGGAEGEPSHTLSIQRGREQRVIPWRADADTVPAALLALLRGWEASAASP